MYLNFSLIHNIRVFSIQINCIYTLTLTLTITICLIIIKHMFMVIWLTVKLKLISYI